MDILIIGASISGLFAAAGLSKAGHTVTVIDRAPNDASKFAPQASQIHIFLKRGVDTAEKLLPGFTDNLLQAGAFETEVGKEWAFQFQKGWFARGDAGLSIIPCSRNFFEGILRDTVAKNVSIKFVSNSRVMDISFSRDSSPVVTVESGSGGLEKTFKPDLLIDCSGANTKTPTYLQKSGFGQVQLQTINTYLGYATAFFFRCEAT